MSPEKDKYLVERYPKIFRDRNGDMRTTAMCWGLDCHDGWFNIIEQLCDSIQNYIDLNPHLNITQVVATQVKEKFGGLCFYYIGGDDVIRGMVRLAENMSYNTCEFCGSIENIGYTKGWIYTICKECYDNSTTESITRLEWISNIKK